jgi:nucleoside-diphosphate-sugar epimerase
MDMMYMPDAIDAIVDLLEVDGNKLIHRNAFNITAMAFDPEEIAASIKNVMPEFELDYNVDPIRQGIANSWPNSIDATDAKKEWGFAPKYDLDRMTVDMLEKLSEKLAINS